VVLYVGLDLSRKRLDYHVLDRQGGTVTVGAVPPDAGGLWALARRFASEPVEAALESMNGARFVHDQLERAGWRVEIADAVKVKGLAPLACKTDRIDARVLAELCWRGLVPASGSRARRCGRSGNGPISASTSSDTEPVSRTACTRPCSRTGSPAR
jgi:hypothetical protein